MRHPFDGIIVPEPNSEARPPREPAKPCRRGGASRSSRRSMLRWLVALPASVVGLAAAARATAADGPGSTAPPTGTAPANSRDVPVIGRPRKGFMTLKVVLTPNKRPEGPDSADGRADALAAEWSRQFIRFRDVKVTTLPSIDDVFISFTRFIPKQVIAAVKAHPQVSYLEWVAAATTFALGEEGGGVAEPTTTNTLGEEGGYPTTTFFNEEGGYYPSTTTRMGEEGGTWSPTHPTTTRLGEEGGTWSPTSPTTMRLGEEGGTWSPTSPTTMRLGEEGGGLAPGMPSLRPGRLFPMPKPSPGIGGPMGFGGGR